MSLSTLPQLFKQNNCRFIKPSKVGGVFSLHLTNINSPERCATSISKKQLTNNTARSQISGRRSSSSNALSKNMLNINAHSQFKISKNGSFQQSIIKKRSSQSTFSRDVSALQQIYYKNIMKAKISPEIQIGFPFQTSRTMNNMGINMEEADSMKNRFQLIQKNIQKSFYELQHNKSSMRQIQEHLSVFRINFEDNLSMMNYQLTKRFEQCYKKLSKSRRQTNQQIKINKKELEGIIYEISDAGEVYKLLEDQSNKMRNDCIEDDKLQISRNTTYCKNNIVSTKKNNFIDIFDATKHKRASSIQGTRKNIQNDKNRVSTTSKGRRLINNNQKIKQESQGQQNLFQSIQNAIYKDLNVKFPTNNNEIILNGRQISLIRNQQNEEEINDYY